MKRSWILILLAGFLSLGTNTRSQYRYIPNHSFGRGERLEYRVHVGFINAGEGVMQVSNQLYQLNKRVCYKVQIIGKTVGIWDYIIKVRDEWGSYIDTTSIIPHKFYRNIEEGGYRKYESVDFDPLRDSVLVRTYNKEDRSLKRIEHFKVPPHAQDLVSGYYYLRTLDYTKVQPGQVLALKAFFDNEIYDFKAKFIGRESLKTKLGEFEALVISPILPKNDLFEGEDAVKVWLSDDKYKIPLKVKASMWVGALELDIKSYTQSRYK